MLKKGLKKKRQEVTKESKTMKRQKKAEKEKEDEKYLLNNKDEFYLFTDW